MNKFNNLYKFLLNLIEIRRINPHVKVGSLFVIIAGALLGSFPFEMGRLLLGNKTKIVIFEFKASTVDNIILCVGIPLLLLGVYLCLIGLRKTKNKFENKVFYYIKGIENQRDEAPKDELPKMSRFYTPQIIKFTVVDKNPDEIFKKLEYNRQTIIDKVNQSLTNEVFFAGLARVPYLYFIGHSFRDGHSTIRLLDHSHRKSKWFLLDDYEDEKIHIEIASSITDDNPENISLIIEFTCDIPIEDLPKPMQSNFVKISLNEKKHNQITSQEVLNRIVDDVIQEMIKLNKKCRKIHLFIAAQSSFVFSLGRRYQDGMLGDIEVYNYNPNKKYNWSISLEAGTLKLKAESNR